MFMWKYKATHVFFNKSFLTEIIHKSENNTQWNQLLRNLDFPGYLSYVPSRSWAQNLSGLFLQTDAIFLRNCALEGYTR